jgi:hypothetical protein
VRKPADEASLVPRLVGGAEIIEDHDWIAHRDIVARQVASSQVF